MLFTHGTDEIGLVGVVRLVSVVESATSCWSDEVHKKRNL